jgi:hypothetical protein
VSPIRIGRRRQDNRYADVKNEDDKNH